MKVDNALLKRLVILYVEDDEHIRNELTALLSKFFKNIYTAVDGQDGLEQFLEKKDEINIIISDINMPKLNGIEMVKKIREEQHDIPVIYTTAYSDNDYLFESIKLKIYDYIIKPIDVRALLNSISDLSQILYHEELITEQNKELEKYKDALDKYNIVIKTDTNMHITYVNEFFCETTGYDNKELLNQEFNVLRHQDTDLDMYKTMYADVLRNVIWHGKIKQVKKDGTSFVVDSQMMAMVNETGEIEGTICIQRNITEELNKKREIQIALMKDKGDIFIKSKAGSAEQTKEIMSLKAKLEEFEEIIEKAKTDKNKYLYLVDKVKSDNKKLKSELNYYKNNAVTEEEQSALTLRTNSENHKLRQEVTQLTAKTEELKAEIDKAIKQTKVTYEIKIDDLEKELEEYKNKLDAIDDGEVLIQKVEYWKLKAKSESKKVEELERKVMQHADSSLLQKLFNK